MREPLAVQVVRLDPSLPLPQYGHPGDAGIDLYAGEDILLEPGQRQAVRTGLAVALPVGFVGLVHPRSGLALKHGIGMVNAPGTIDAGYRGEIKVLLINHDREQAVSLAKGDRIAQLLVQRVESISWEEVAQLPDSERGSGGFGSTGGGAGL